jgi:hypothetical protein
LLFIPSVRGYKGAIEGRQQGRQIEAEERIGLIMDRRFPWIPCLIISGNRDPRKLLGTESSITFAIRFISADRGKPAAAESWRNYLKSEQLTFVFKQQNK